MQFKIIQPERRGENKINESSISKSMKQKYFQNIKIVFKKAKRKIAERFLYLFYKLLKSELFIVGVSEPDAIVLSGNHFTVFWQVLGCYKITINETISLPGNINLIQLDSLKFENPLRIKFHGVSETLEKSFTINLVKLVSRQSHAFVTQMKKNQFRARIPAIGQTRYRSLIYKNDLMPYVPNIEGVYPVPFIRATKNIEPLFILINL